MHIAQLIAAHAVKTVLDGHNLNQALPQAISVYPHATPQQRGAATDYTYNALRHRAAAECYLRELLQKPLTDARLHALLLVAITQLVQDEQEAFTIVNQAVTASSLFSRPKSAPWMKGLTNGVLRNFLRQRTVLLNQYASHPDVLYGYPVWWIHTLKAQYPESWSTMLTAGNHHPPMTLRLNLKHLSVEAYLERLHSVGIEARVLGSEADAAQAILLLSPMAVERIPGFLEGWVSVQDWGAQWAAHLLDVQPGQRVLDACAAPGGKTGHILELADVRLTALDNDAERLKRVQSNLDRLKKTATLSVGDAAAQDWWDGQRFDRILADVPCSASGIVRRHVDIKWLRRSDDVGVFATQQAQILRNLWQLLEKGGKLLYATCSVFQEENALQIERFLAQTPDARCLTLPNFPLGQQGQLIPCADHDGFFYALLEKV